MEALTSLQAWMILADLLGMISVILSLYVLILNPRQLANRLASVAIAILAVNALVSVSLLRANTSQDAYLPTILLAAVVPAIGPALMMASLAMLKPGWLSGKHRWIIFSLMFLAFVPSVLTIADIAFGTSIYYVGLDAASYRGGSVEFGDVISKLVGQVVLYIDLILIDTLLIVPLVYFSFFDKTQEKSGRGLALMLLTVQVIVLVSSFAGEAIPQGILNLFVGLLYILAYGVAAFRQLVSSRSLQAGRLQGRLTMLMVAIAIPTLIFIASSLIRYSGDHIEEDANSTLSQNTDFLVTLAESWLKDNAIVLQNLAIQPDIVSMNSVKQKPILESYAKTYPYMYLISTTDLTGMNVARSDAQSPIDYKDRLWFTSAASGTPLTYQTLIGRTTGQPAMVVSVPISSPTGQVAGVAMFASYLTELSDHVLLVKLGETGYAYLIDDKNQLVAHPDLNPGSSELIDFSNAAPVQALRNGIEPPLIYSDGDGVTWRAYYTTIENGWAVVVQQQEAELFQTYRNLQFLSLILIGGGGLVMIALVWASIRQAVQPINSLTQTVKDIAAGNLDRVAVVESEDEIGTLARAFNIMTNQVRSLVGSLERRVAERTLDLEHRSAQLQAAADVGRAAASIRNLDELLLVVTRLISERFGFYHVGIFLLDEQGEYALLRAANSPGGQRMLARGHKLLVGQQGIVGYVTRKREPRIALNVGEDTAFFTNLDLPDTQSEMALPLQVGDELLGALDVQSVQPNAFTEQDVETLQVLADQVAIAINGSQLLQRTQELLESERRGFGEITKRSWLEQVKMMDNVGFIRERSGLHPITSAPNPEAHELLQDGRVAVDQNDPRILYVPVSIRTQVIGILRLVHEETTSGWTDNEIGMIRSLAEQLGVALESARSYQQTRVNAQRDRILGEVNARVRETLDVQTILRTATQEVRQALDIPKVVIHLGTPPENNGNGKSTSGGGHA